ncbi:MAG: porin family protein [Methylocystis sp.]|nr:porin family protein [Methylocystis sp.]MBI3274894.1 porin family protein [Methylocystis sp.]
MRHSVFSAFIVPAALLAASAHAADLGRGARPPQDYYAPVPVFTWQGLYLGLNAGYGLAAFQNDGADLLGRPRGGMVGFTGGYNFVFAQNFLLGLEADFDFTNMKASQMPFFGLAGTGAVDDIFTLRARAGYTLDRALLYATGGFAGSRDTASVSNVSTGFSGRQSTFQTGWAVGAGLEFMLTNNLSAKGEYLFTSVGSDRFFDFSTNALQTSVNTSALKGGLNYHF